MKRIEAVASRKVELIGAASGLGAPDSSVAFGPAYLQAHRLEDVLAARGIQARWSRLLAPRIVSPRPQAVAEFSNRLAGRVGTALRRGNFPLVLGGDHSIAAGTWRGAAEQIRASHDGGALGLLWVDAHMDAHTIATSDSGNFHGMPLASLLGANGSLPALAPEHIALIGVRSFEPAEAELLRRLGVRVYFIDEVQTRGPAAVFEEALAIVTRGTARFGVTIDIDALDPRDAPGTGLPVDDGLRSGDLIPALATVAATAGLCAAEIVEYNPLRDRDGTTRRLVETIAATLLESVRVPVDIN
jgi:arginase